MTEEPVPILTPLTSTTSFHSLKAIEPSQYFTLVTSPPFQFRKVERWTCFSEKVREMLKQVDVPPYRRIEKNMQTLLRDLVFPTFERNGIPLGCADERERSFLLGHADFVLYEHSDSNARPALIGHHCPEISGLYDYLALFKSAYMVRNIGGPSGQARGMAHFMEYEANNAYRVGAGTSTSGGLLNGRVNTMRNDSKEVNVVSAMRNLCNTMLVNGVSYGYLACKTSTLFVKISSSEQSGFQLHVSKGIHCYEHGDALLSVCLESYLCHTPFTELPVFEVSPEAIKSPDVSALSSYEEEFEGRVKWWVTQKMNRKKYCVRLDPYDGSIPNLMAGREQLPYSVRTATIIVNNESGERAVVFLSNEGEPKLSRIASMLQYLNCRKAMCAPQIIVFGRTLNFHMLAFKAPGRPVRLEDLHAAQVVSRMHSVLSELHEEGVMLGDVALSSFFIDFQGAKDNKEPVLSIAGLSSAKLFRKVPLVARHSEHSKLDHLIRGAE